MREFTVHLRLSRPARVRLGIRLVDGPTAFERFRASLNRPQEHDEDSEPIIIVLADLGRPSSNARQ